MREATFSLMLVGSYGVFRECLASVLSRIERFEVCGQTDNVAEAIELCRKSAPDVVLFDLDACGEKAPAALRRLKREFPTLRVISLSSTASDDLVLSLVEAGISGHMDKNSSLDDLAGTIDQVLKGEVLCSPRVAYRIFSGLSDLDRQWRRSARVEALKLTHRELEILQLISEGLSNKKIAERLFLSTSTIKNHVHHILRKLQADHRWDAVIKARRKHWLPDRPAGRAGQPQS